MLLKLRYPNLLSGTGSLVETPSGPSNKRKKSAANEKSGKKKTETESTVSKPGITIKFKLMKRDSEDEKYIEVHGVTMKQITFNCDDDKNKMIREVEKKFFYDEKDGEKCSSIGKLRDFKTDILDADKVSFPASNNETVEYVLKERSYAHSQKTLVPTFFLACTKVAQTEVNFSFCLIAINLLFVGLFV